MGPARFEFIPNPLRRRGLRRLRWLTGSVPAARSDAQPPDTPARMAHYLTSRGILPDGMNSVAARDALAVARLDVIAAPPASSAHAFDGPLRLPAQWEPIEAVVIAWPSFHASLWKAHAEIAEGISPVARVDILVADPLWAAAAWLYIERRGRAKLDQIRFIHLQTGDIRVRDDGPLVGYRPDGTRAALGTVHDSLPACPSASGDVMPRCYGALLDMPIRPLDLYIEGGSFCSDGQGTLFVSERIYARNPRLGRAEVERRLHSAFSFDRLIALDPLWRDQTGHLDLVMTLAGPNTILINSPALRFNRARIEKAQALLRREMNANGQPCRIVELPVLSPNLNRGVYPVWRSYANSLTVNGRVLMPVFRAGADARALAVYQNALPDFEIVPVDCSQAANGGGAVHCLTKEIPKA